MANKFEYPGTKEELTPEEKAINKELSETLFKDKAEKPKRLTKKEKLINETLTKGLLEDQEAEKSQYENLASRMQEEGEEPIKLGKREDPFRDPNAEEKAKIDEFVNKEFAKRQAELLSSDTIHGTNVKKYAPAMTPAEEAQIKANIAKSYQSGNEVAARDMSYFEDKRAVEKYYDAAIEGKRKIIATKQAEVADREKDLREKELRTSSQDIAGQADLAKEREEISEIYRKINAEQIAMSRLTHSKQTEVQQLTEKRKSRATEDKKMDMAEAEQGLTEEELAKLNEKTEKGALKYKGKERLAEIDRIKQERGYAELEKQRAGIEALASLEDTKEAAEKIVESDKAKVETNERTSKLVSELISADEEEREFALETLRRETIAYYDLSEETTLKDLLKLKEEGKVDFNFDKSKKLEKPASESAEPSQEKGEQFPNKAEAGFEKTDKQSTTVDSKEKEAEAKAKAAKSTAVAGASHGKATLPHHTEAEEFEYESDEDNLPLEDVMKRVSQKLAKALRTEASKIKPRDAAMHYLNDKKFKTLREELKKSEKLNFKGLSEEKIYDKVIRTFEKELAAKGRKYNPETGKESFFTALKNIGRNDPEIRKVAVNPLAKEIMTREAARVESQFQSKQPEIWKKLENTNRNEVFETLIRERARDNGFNPSDRLDKLAEAVDLSKQREK